jgi:hypothetical protein
MSYLIIYTKSFFVLWLLLNYGSKNLFTNKSFTYYIDSQHGNDFNNGRSKKQPWKSFVNLEQTLLQPGDTLRFKRGSKFSAPLFISSSGTPNNFITLSDYGNPLDPAPAFTNQNFKQGDFGNCIRIKGSYIIIENLYFHNTSAFKTGDYTSDGGWIVWEMGAVYIDKGATHCIVRNNEIFDCPVGIKSYGTHILITNNYIHDCNRVLREWNWGAIGIWLGNDFQEVSYNRIFNYRTENKNMVFKGAGGGAIEVDDSRFSKSHISIHHNYTKDCQGFLETTSKENGIALEPPDYRNFTIHHNISDDYQQFLLLWRGTNFKIDHNTIIRRKINSNDLGVIVSTQRDAKNLIRNNIIITENVPIFNYNRKAVPQNIIQNNLYYAASGEIIMGNEGPGENAVFANPLLVNYHQGVKAEHFKLKNNSPAINKGLQLGYQFDYTNNKYNDQLPDVGAFEYNKN